MPKNFVGENFNVPLFLGIDNIYASGGYVIVFCRNFFVSECRKFSYVTPLVFVNFGERKLFETREGVIHFFRSKTFCPTEPKKIVGEAFFVSHNFWYRKNFWRRGRGVSGVSVGNSLSHFAEKNS